MHSQWFTMNTLFIKTTSGWKNRWTQVKQSEQFWTQFKQGWIIVNNCEQLWTVVNNYNGTINLNKNSKNNNQPLNGKNKYSKNINHNGNNQMVKCWLCNYITTNNNCKLKATSLQQVSHCKKPYQNLVVNTLT